MGFVSFTTCDFVLFVPTHNTLKTVFRFEAKIYSILFVSQV